MDERARADALDRFLDELASGPAGDRPTLEPELTKIARRYRAIGRMPAPPGVRNRVRQRLAEQASAGEESPSFRPFSSNGRHAAIDRVALPVPASPRRRALAQASLALLLVVLAGGLWLTVLRGPVGTGEQAAGRPAPVTVSARVTGISGIYSTLVMRRLTLEPGSTYQEFELGTTLFVIEQGTLTAGSLERGEQLLGPNGSGSVQNGTTLTLRNDSDVTGVVFVAFLYSPATMNPQVGQWPGVTAVTLATRVITGTLPVHATMKLQRLTVPAGEQTASWQTDGPAVLRVEEGEAGLTLTGDGVSSPFASGVERIESSGRTVQLPPGIAVDTRNSGTTPLVLTIVDISSGSEPDSAPAT